MVMMEGDMFPNHLLEDLATIYHKDTKTQRNSKQEHRLSREGVWIDRNGS